MHLWEDAARHVRGPQQMHPTKNRKAISKHRRPTAGPVIATDKIQPPVLTVFGDPLAADASHRMVTVDALVFGCSRSQMGCNYPNPRPPNPHRKTLGCECIPMQWQQMLSNPRNPGPTQPVSIYTPGFLAHEDRCTSCPRAYCMGLGNYPYHFDVNFRSLRPRL